MRTGFTGGYALEEVMYYMRACLAGLSRNCNHFGLLCIFKIIIGKSIVYMHA